MGSYAGHRRISLGHQQAAGAERLGRMAVIRALIDEVERQLADLVPDEEEEDEEREGYDYEDRMDDHSDYSSEDTSRSPVESSIFNSSWTPRQGSSVDRYAWGPVQQRPI
jgi:hypothetical protein